jgi:cobyrinic acid a,c-diamide synthase
MRGLLIASPMSGAGKTTFTLGLLRALKKRGIDVAPAKAGPDYIDPAFHEAASARGCVNLDPWAMRDSLLMANAHRATVGDRLLVVEAMMGLFDGAADGTGSAADLAVLLNLPIVFVVNCAKLSQSVAPIVDGFNRFRPGVSIAGVVLNNVGSPRHEAMLRQALANSHIDVIGAIPRNRALNLPERHLGLVQAGEHAGLDALIDLAARLVTEHCDLDRMLEVANRVGSMAPASAPALPPLGQRIAIARDIAFAFCYRHLLDGWQDQGAEISFFSPLANQGPAPDCDAIYLPGGYPELHAGKLAAAGEFIAALRGAARTGVQIYGECGGYMVLGEGLTDQQNVQHAMLGLLPHSTSFTNPKLHLGYRRVIPRGGHFRGRTLTAHEFHYASVSAERAADRLFDVSDATGTQLEPAGQRRGSVAGSFLHVIDLAGGS